MTKKQVSIFEAKTHLSRLINEALSGIEIVIARGKKPVVKLTVLDEDGVSPALKVLGKYDGKAKISDDFDDPMEEFGEYS